MGRKLVSASEYTVDELSCSNYFRRLKQNVSLATRLEVLNASAAHLAEFDVDNSRREAEWLMQELLGISRIDLLSRPGEAVSLEERHKLTEAIKRRSQQEPLQYIIGSATFYGRDFMVDPAVLIPRPETELLVEWALSNLVDTEGARVLDLGTGSGCIPISIALENSGSMCFGADVSEDALEVARKNARSLAPSVSMLNADILSRSSLQQLPGPFNILVSNPPYIAENERPSIESQVKDFEPDIALFAGEDPLHFYRAIVNHAPLLLVPGGQVGVEIHSDHGPEVETLFVRAGFNSVEVLQDLAGKNRVVTARI